MNCTLCKTGMLKANFTNITLQRGETIVLVKKVPAEVCDVCGEYYLDEQTSRRLLNQAADASNRNAELEIIRYAA